LAISRNAIHGVVLMKQNKIFSITTKISLVVIGALMILALLFTTLSEYRLQQQLYHQQHQLLQQGQQQLLTAHDTFTTQLKTWVESFASMMKLTQQADYQQFSEQLYEQYESLQLHFNVNDLWLFDPQQQLVIATREPSKQILAAMKKVFASQEPYNGLVCGTGCQQVVIVPLLNKMGETGVVAITSSMVDLLYGIQTYLNNDVALLYIDKEQPGKLTSAHYLSNSNYRLFKQAIETIPDEKISSVNTKGIELTLDRRSYFLMLLPVAENDQAYYFLAMLNNITEFVNQQHQQRLQYLGLIVLAFSLLAIATYFISSRLTHHLLTLAEALPLLARKNYREFFAMSLKPRGRVADEVDILVDSVNDMAKELSRLDNEIELKNQALEKIALYDELTGLPNRHLLNQLLQQLLANRSVDTDRMAILLLDIDDFKKVNDSHGHSAGDQLLKQVAERLAKIAPKSTVIARFGGDEFVLVLEKLTGLEQAIHYAQTILETLKQPIRIDNSLFYISVSIGIAYLKAGTQSAAEDLIRQADIAMYSAKKEGHGQYHVFTTEMQQRVANRVAIESAVRVALANNEFSLSLQPQVCATTYRIIGFEALIRWQHPEQGFIPPDKFLPVLEHSSYMIELGYWVIRHSFELSKKLDQVVGLEQTRIAINLSAIQFADPNLVQYIREQLKAVGVPAYRFEFEITEQTLVKDIDNAVSMMVELKSLGFHFAIDDYGTGYSSLSYLKSMPIDILKIDKSFIDGMLQNKSDYQIIVSTIALAKSLDIKTVAEGVEHQEQLAMLQQKGCDYIQGYYFSRPIPEHEFSLYLSQHVVSGRLQTAH
jgi:diguanylate cyclase (GGDEF)-like protein